ncbi:MAG: Smr/MutS family protein [Candidatus Uhrbacteria bacterium]|nr:Smr/MutS family protein [Candidatus Uhrbacteria bacterium]
MSKTKRPQKLSDKAQKDAEAAIFAAELGSVPEIDLHGQTVNQALSMLDGFLNHECLQGTEAVKIIHGRGTGALQKAVRLFLQDHPLVVILKDASSMSQQGGVTYAALERVK